jgi:hypothetical protein
MAQDAPADTEDERAVAMYQGREGRFIPLVDVPSQEGLIGRISAIV